MANLFGTIAKIATGEGLLKAGGAFLGGVAKDILQVKGSSSSDFPALGKSEAHRPSKPEHSPLDPDSKPLQSFDKFGSVKEPRLMSGSINIERIKPEDDIVRAVNKINANIQRSINSLNKNIFTVFQYAKDANRQTDARLNIVNQNTVILQKTTRMIEDKLYRVERRVQILERSPKAGAGISRSQEEDANQYENRQAGGPNIIKDIAGYAIGAGVIAGAGALYRGARKGFNKLAGRGTPNQTETKPIEAEPERLPVENRPKVLRDKGTGRFVSKNAKQMGLLEKEIAEAAKPSLFKRFGGAKTIARGVGEGLLGLGAGIPLAMMQNDNDEQLDKLRREHKKRVFSWESFKDDTKGFFGMEQDKTGKFDAKPDPQSSPTSEEFKQVTEKLEIKRADITMEASNDIRLTALKEMFLRSKKLTIESDEFIIKSPNITFSSRPKILGEENSGSSGNTEAPTQKQLPSLTAPGGLRSNLEKGFTRQQMGAEWQGEHPANAGATAGPRGAGPGGGSRPRTITPSSEQSNPQTNVPQQYSVPDLHRNPRQGYGWKSGEQVTTPAVAGTSPSLSVALGSDAANFGIDAQGNVANPAAIAGSMKYKMGKLLGKIPKEFSDKIDAGKPFNLMETMPPGGPTSEIIKQLKEQGITYNPGTSGSPAGTSSETLRRGKSALPGVKNRISEEKVSTSTNMQKYIAGIGYLESDLNQKAASSSEAGNTGYFKFNQADADKAARAGLPDPRKGSLQEQAASTQKYIEHFFPKAAENINKGNFDDAHKELSKFWVSLPGGSQSGQSPSRVSEYQRILDGKGADKVNKVFPSDVKNAVSENGKMVPGGVISKARELIEGGGNYDPNKIAAFMKKEGYPMNGAWCGEFMASVVKSEGGKPPKDPQIASNWLNWEKHVEPGDVKPGDNVIAARRPEFHGRLGTGQPGDMGGHVTAVDPSRIDIKNNRFWSDGGNQGGAGWKKLNEYELRKASPEDKKPAPKEIVRQIETQSFKSEKTEYPKSSPLINIPSFKSEKSEPYQAVPLTSPTSPFAIERLGQTFKSEKTEYPRSTPQWTPPPMDDPNDGMSPNGKPEDFWNKVRTETPLPIEKQDTRAQDITPPDVQEEKKQTVEEQKNIETPPAQTKPPAEMTRMPQITHDVEAQPAKPGDNGYGSRQADPDGVGLGGGSGW